MTLRARITTATAVATCLFVASACQAPTEITLEIATDVPCAETRGTAITVGRIGDLDEKRLPTVQTLKCDEGGRIGTLVIAPQPVTDREDALPVTFRIRYRTGVHERMRVLWRGLPYELVGQPIDVKGAKVALDLPCVQGLGDGR